MSGYIGTQPVPQATQTRDVFTATSGQTSFATSGYTPNFLDVWLNGVKLVNGDDFTATNGSDVVLTTGATAGDTVEVLSYSTYEVNAQTYTGGLTVNNDAATVLTVDRATSDGSIVEIKKDGTTVGSIGVASGQTALTIGNADTGLSFQGNQNDAIFPYNVSTNALRDNAVSLGYSSSRFKDLYLSGGVYLGGTGAANLLDDYEEGTWTPSFNGYSTGFTGNYTKVGNLVTCRITRWGAIPADSITGNVIVTGLPFNGQRSSVFLGHLRGGTVGGGYRPVGMVQDTSMGLFTDASWGNNNVYNTSHANWSGSYITQNNSTSVIIDWIFTYHAS